MTTAAMPEEQDQMATPPPADGLEGENRRIIETRFGPMEFVDDQSIDMPRGVLGFAEHRSFGLAYLPNKFIDQLMILQSLDGPRYVFPGAAAQHGCRHHRPGRSCVRLPDDGSRSGQGCRRRDRHHSGCRRTAADIGKPARADNSEFGYANRLAICPSERKILGAARLDRKPIVGRAGIG